MLASLSAELAPINPTWRRACVFVIASEVLSQAMIRSCHLVERPIWILITMVKLDWVTIRASGRTASLTGRTTDIFIWNTTST
jgi:hypothetical protein